MIVAQTVAALITALFAGLAAIKFWRTGEEEAALYCGCICVAQVVLAVSIAAE